MSEIITTPVGVNYNPNNAQYPFWNEGGGSSDPRALISVSCEHTIAGKKHTYNWRQQHADLSTDEIIVQVIDTEDGVTYTPHLSEDGILSFTNPAGLPNPEPVDITGPAGKDGEAGPRGLPGEKGEPGFSPVVSVTEYTGGHQVSITYAGGVQVFNVDNGKAGEPGKAPDISVSVGIKEDGEGTRGVVTKTGEGDAQAFRIDLYNIRGERGEIGPGASIEISDIAGGHRVDVIDNTGSKSFNVMDGTEGAAGFSPTVTIAEIVGGHKVGITDKAGEKSFNVMDGARGEAGPVPIPSADVTAEGDVGVTVDVGSSPDGRPTWKFKFTGISGGGGSGGTVPAISASASVSDTVGTPAVSVERTGSDEAPHFAFNFSGLRGSNGESPAAKVEAITGGARLTVTDKDGTTSVDIKDGAPGMDGYSPDIIETPVEGGHEITIANKDGSESFIIKDGKDGADGERGAEGQRGPAGDTPEITITATQDGKAIPVTKGGSGAAQSFQFDFSASGGGGGTIKEYYTTGGGIYATEEDKVVITVPQITISGGTYLFTALDFEFYSTQTEGLSFIHLPFNTGAYSSIVNIKTEYPSPSSATKISAVVRFPKDPSTTTHRQTVTTDRASNYRNAGFKFYHYYYENA